MANPDDGAFLRIKERLERTPNEQLQNVIENLLPKLIPMVDESNFELVAAIVDTCILRTRAYPIQLPIVEMITAICNNNDNIKSCNMAIKIINIAIESCPLQYHQKCYDILVVALPKFQVFEQISNSLCYYVYRLFPTVIPCQFDSEISTTANVSFWDIIGEYFFDLTLLQKSFVSDAVGSVTTGLTDVRIKRITLNRSRWDIHEINSFKLALIQSFTNAWLPARLIIASLISCLCASEEKVRSEAVFKLNGAQSLYKIHDHVDSISTTLICLCLINQDVKFPTISLAESNQNIANRSPLALSFKLAVMEFVIKEFSNQLSMLVDIVIRLFVGSVLYQLKSVQPEQLSNGANSPMGFRYYSLTLKLASILVDKLSREQLTLFVQIPEEISIYFQSPGSKNIFNILTYAQIASKCALLSLRPFIEKSSKFSQEESTRTLTLRDSCYLILNSLISKLPPSTVETQNIWTNTANNYFWLEQEMITLLFKLLDIEGAEPCVSLMSVLHNFRLAISKANENEDGQSVLMTPALDTSIKKLLNDSRNSVFLKTRMITSQWAKALFGWKSYTFETYFVLSQVNDDATNEYIHGEFKSLSSLLIPGDYQSIVPKQQQHGKIFLNIFVELLLFTNSDAFRRQHDYHRGHYYVFKTMSICLQQFLNKFGYEQTNNRFDVTSQWTKLAYPTNTRASNSVQFEIETILIAATNISRLSLLHNLSSSYCNYPASDLNFAVSYMIEVLQGFLLLLPGESNLRQLYRSKIVPHLLSALQACQDDNNLMNSHLAATSEFICRLSSTISIVCIDADINYVSLLLRSLLIQIPGQIHNWDAQANIPTMSDQSITQFCSSSQGVFCTLVHSFLVLMARRDASDFMRDLTARLKSQLCSIIRSVLSLKQHSDCSRMNDCIENAQVLLIQSFSVMINTNLNRQVDNESSLEITKNLTELMSSCHNASIITEILSTLSRATKTHSLIAEIRESFQHFSLTSIWRCAVSESAQVAKKSKDQFSYYEIFRLSEAIINHVFFANDVELFKINFVNQLKSTCLRSRADTKSNEKIVASILLLVYTRITTRQPQLQDEFRANLFQWLNCFLHNLASKEIVLQDICVMGICNLYYFILSLSRDDSSLVAEMKKLAHEVIVVLCRDRLFDQPAGIAPAGGAVSYAVDTNTATNALTGNVTEDNILNNDPLMRAASLLESQLGLALRNRIDNAPGIPVNESNTDRTTSQSFGVYTTFAKLARKNGSDSLIFALLPLVRKSFLLEGIQIDENDPAFNNSESNRYSQTMQIFKRFVAPQCVLTREDTLYLFPKLFAARFETLPEINETVKELYNKLYSEDTRKSLMFEYQHDIIKYSLTYVDSKSWRDRVMACLCIESLLPSLQWNILRRHLNRLWDKVFNLLDDVYEQCRNASMRLMKLLSEIVISQCDSQISIAEDLNENIKFLIEKLLSTGLISPCAESKGFSFGVLIRLVTTAKHSLKLYQPQLISIMVECMSAFEPEMLQYMQFHTSKLNMTDESLEKTRLEISRKSPMQDALNLLLQTLQADSVTATLTELCHHFIRGVGLATRVSAIESIVYLSELFPEPVGAQCAIIGPSIAVSLLENSTSNPVTLQRALLDGLGAVSRIVSKEVLIDICRLFVTQYKSFEAKRVDSSYYIASSLDQIVHRASERLCDREIQHEILICSYIGSFESNVEASEIWRSVWNEALMISTYASKTTALKHILVKTVDLIQKMLCDNSWPVRLLGLAAYQDLAKTIEMPKNFCLLASCVPNLFNLVSKGSIWNGQQVVLETMVLLAIKCENLADYEIYIDSTEPPSLLECEDASSLVEFVNSTEPSGTSRSSASRGSNAGALSLHRIVRLLLQECRRGDNEYRFIAIQSMSSLPWRSIVSKNPLIYFDVLMPLCNLIGATEEHLNITAIEDFIISLRHTDASTVEKKFGESGLQASQSVPSIEINKESSADKDKLYLAYSKKPKSGDLFGSRYSTNSSTVPNSRKAPGLKRLSNAKNTYPLSNVVIVSQPYPITPNLSIGSMKSPLIDDPAFRTKAVECIVAGWPSVLTIMQYPALSEFLGNLSNLSYTLHLHQTRKLLLYWSIYTFNDEVWSLRKSAVNLMGQVLISIPVDRNYSPSGTVPKVFKQDIAKSVFKSIFDATSDIKYASIRTTAYDAVYNILRNSYELCKLTDATVVMDSKMSASEALDSSESCLSLNDIHQLVPIIEIILGLTRQSHSVLTNDHSWKRSYVETHVDALNALSRAKVALDSLQR